jgi:hydrogenase maturation protease
MTSRRQTIKVIGIGSPFGDDRLGWVAIDLLKQQQIAQKCHQHLILESCDRPGAQLIEIMRGIDSVILIDAVKSNKVPIGTLHCLKNDEIFTVNDGCLSSHAFGVGQALQLASVLGDLPQSVIFYGLEIDDKNTTDNLSEVVQKKLYDLIGLIADEIRQQNVLF